MKIDNRIIRYFAKSALDPFHKVDRINDDEIQMLVDDLINQLPLSLYQQVKESPNWKNLYEEGLDDISAKKMWLKFRLPQLIDELRIQLLGEQSDKLLPMPYNHQSFSYDLLDSNKLVNLDIFSTEPIDFFGQGFVLNGMKYTLCQCLGGTNSSYWICLGLKRMLKDGHIIYGRLDPLMFDAQDNLSLIHISEPTRPY